MGRKNRVVPISKPVATNIRPTLQRPSSPIPVSCRVATEDLVIEDMGSETEECVYALAQAPMIPSLKSRARFYMNDCQNKQTEPRQDVLTLNVPTYDDGFPIPLVNYNEKV